MGKKLTLMELPVPENPAQTGLKKKKKEFVVSLMEKSTGSLVTGIASARTSIIVWNFLSFYLSFCPPP